MSLTVAKLEVGWHVERKKKREKHYNLITSNLAHNLWLVCHGCELVEDSEDDMIKLNSLLILIRTPKQREQEHDTSILQVQLT